MKMDDIDRGKVCGICGKRLPGERETELILLARKKVGQTELERHAEEQEFDFCVSFGLQSHKPGSIRDLLESEKSENGLSYEDWHDKKGAVRGFQVGKRSVGPDPRVGRPLWCDDDIATRLVLTLQYPPEQFEEMYELIRKHWRGIAPMHDRRRDMMELRKRGEKVFGEAILFKKLHRYAYPYLEERLKEREFFAKQRVGSFYLREDASDVLAECYLPLLKSEGYILSWRSWNFLRWKPAGGRHHRYGMDRSIPEWISLREKITALYEELRQDPSRFPFMNKLLPSELGEIPGSRRHLLLGILRHLWESPLRGLFSFPYLLYVFRTHLRGNFIRRFGKRFADTWMIAFLVLTFIASYAAALGGNMAVLSVFHMHPNIFTICLLLPASAWIPLLIHALSITPSLFRKP